MSPLPPLKGDFVEVLLTFGGSPVAASTELFPLSLSLIFLLLFSLTTKGSFITSLSLSLSLSITEPSKMSTAIDKSSSFISVPPPASLIIRKALLKGAKGSTLVTIFGGSALCGEGLFFGVTGPSLTIFT